MWSFAQTELSNDVLHLKIATEDGRLSYGDVLDLLEKDEVFQAAFIQTLADIPFAAYRWETPALSKTNLEHPFEFVCINSPELQVSPDKTPFLDQFAQANPGEVLAFSNLGGDAELIVPMPLSDKDDFAHIAAFTHNAPLALQHNFWRTVACTVKAHLCDKPLWLSTAGGGVAWLHARLDCHPKYYAHSPYKQFKPLP